MAQKIEDRLSKLPENWVMLCVVSEKKYGSFIDGLIKNIALKPDASCAYINVNKPQAVLKQEFSNNGLGEKKIFFIDCISKMLGEKAEKTENAVFIESPTDLTGISIATDEATHLMKQASAKEMYLVVDTLSTLLIHNTEQSIAKFAHFITGRIRLLGLKAVIITLEKETSEKLVSQMSQFCDEVVYIN